MNKALLILSTLGIVAAAWGSVASPVSAGNVPLPAKRPRVDASAAAPTYEMTGAIPHVVSVATVSTDLKSGLDALSDKDAPRALAIRDSMAPTSLDRHILTWAIAVSGQPGIPSHEIAAAQRELKGWPGLQSLRANSERAMLAENPAPADVLSAFGTTAPETPEGAIILARALVATGNTTAAQKVVRRIWLGDSLDIATEDNILEEFSGLLGAADHKARMDYLLFRNRALQAKRFGDLGKAQTLYKAWSALINRLPDTDALIAAVDRSWGSDPAYLYIRIEQLRRKEKYVEAAKLLAQVPSDPARLINPGSWWNEQRIVSRGLVDMGQYKSAYRIVANHAAQSPTDVVDAEFHAGWYALRGLNDPETAANHFRMILAVSDRPISVSRAWYWLGRAADAGGPGDAREFYSKAATHASTFYGQLAAAKLKRAALSVAYPTPSAADRDRFQSREAVQAISRLEAAGHAWRADSLYRALAEQLQSPGELAILAARAEKTRGHQLSLQIGKIAYGRGIDVAALAFPIGVIPPNANISGSGKALAYAIARQESAFNPAAVSGANARGLLQLLPGTAKGVASRYGLAYSPEKLTQDAGYNATLGAHYLGEQIDSFDGSYILTFIAYNAGPRRVPEWINRFGDPRGKPIDEVVDWIERIPFPETRGYVQRVMENYQVYKSRLGQQANIEQDLRFGR
ncbi:lytic transglycosylase domain-containing protein [Ferirhizobium litorale]|uniref:Lytic transglycosylase domain-containing protein n=1 Tax=Ferirhizobium litorale TaxID=2927786 RepID=A0AAE3QAB5_9HYPH|nr:lytic transglycosylase domain-containing protein [Fererhizobium litorale]MDI7921295.1 lytic transglycosylase domain-containing protein [Fererhizobium litorale]